MKRSRLGRKYDADKARDRREWHDAVLERDEHTCQLNPRRPMRTGSAFVSEPPCEGRLHAHHVLPRSRGGRDELDNGLTLCRAHHEWAHQNPERAKALGVLR